VHITVPKKHTSSGTKLEFMRIIVSKVRLACTTKNSEVRIVGGGAQQLMKRCVICKKFSGCAVD
jgi:hypothetical protein